MKLLYLHQSPEKPSIRINTAFFEQNRKQKNPRIDFFIRNRMCRANRFHQNKNLASQRQFVIIL